MNPLALSVRMTGGQRWTAALTLGLALLVLLYGVPRATDIAAVGAPAPATERAPETQSTPPPEGLSTGPPAAAAPTVVRDPAQIGSRTAVLAQPPGEAAAEVGIRPPLLISEPPRVVAAVLQEDDALPSRDDQSIATLFLKREGITAAVVPVRPDAPDTCARLSAAGNLVVAGRGLDPSVRNCLVRGGRTVLAFDADGTQVPGVISTRRGFADSLVDLVRWARSNGELTGKVGIVVAASGADALKAAQPALRSAGLSAAAVATVADDADAAALSPAVQRFVASGIARVLFVVPVRVQSQWVAQHEVLDQSVRFLVSDTYDGVIQETYPPTFDGARAHTSLIVPWRARTSGPTAEQADCANAFTASAVPPVLLEGEETVRVFAWCQHALLLADALREQAPLRALGRLRLDSPLTTALGPLSPGDFGPTQDVSLTWRQSCLCWVPDGSPRTRPGDPEDVRPAISGADPPGRSTPSRPSSTRLRSARRRRTTSAWKPVPQLA